MEYLGHEYKLKPIAKGGYYNAAEKFDTLVSVRGLEAAMRTLTAGDQPMLTETIIDNAGEYQEVYGHGAGYYIAGFGEGLAALRGLKPGLATPRINEEDWEKVTARELELQARPALTTLELIGGIGLLEVRGVNPGYVDGYQEANQDVTLPNRLGFSGLGVLHAHDILHFASQREGQIASQAS